MWTPDAVVRARTIHTMDPSNPTAEWMAIHHGRVVALGQGEPPGGPVTDLHDATIVPGFSRRTLPHHVVWPLPAATSMPHGAHLSMSSIRHWQTEQRRPLLGSGCEQPDITR